MPLPISAPTVTCTLSKPLLADGTPGTITSAFLKIDRDLVWGESGETIYKDPVPIPVTSLGTLTFPVVAADAVGMLDSAGSEITYWTYTLRVSISLASGITRVIDYVFQPDQVDDVVDLDLVPQYGAVTVPSILQNGENLNGGGL